MLYPAYIQIGDDQHAHGVEFPDFPGCFSAADDWREINRRAQEAVECHMNGESGRLPEPTPLEKLAADPRYAGGVWMLIDLDLARIDQARHISRSGFLAQAAVTAMEIQTR
ncbi:MAG: type II toxin-antitoxin system HicB family antitoxin [Terracidiphilus sp.]